MPEGAATDVHASIHTDEQGIAQSNKLTALCTLFVQLQEEFYGRDFWKQAAKCRAKDRKAQVIE